MRRAFEGEAVSDSSSVKELKVKQREKYVGLVRKATIKGDNYNQRRPTIKIDPSTFKLLKESNKYERYPSIVETFIAEQSEQLSAVSTNLKNKLAIKPDTTPSMTWPSPVKLEKSLPERIAYVQRSQEASI